MVPLTAETTGTFLHLAELQNRNPVHLKLQLWFNISLLKFPISKINFISKIGQGESDSSEIDFLFITKLMMHHGIARVKNTF